MLGYEEGSTRAARDRWCQKVNARLNSARTLTADVTSPLHQLQSDLALP
jgi:hypothetical protein